MVEFSCYFEDTKKVFILDTDKKNDEAENIEIYCLKNDIDFYH